MQPNPAAVMGSQPARADDGDGLGGGGRIGLEHRPGQFAIPQRAAGFIRAIGKGLLGHPQPGRPASFGQARAGKRDEDQPAVKGRDRVGDGPGRGRMGRRMVVERAVGLDMSQRRAFGPGDGVQRANLGQYAVEDLAGRHRQSPPPEALQIGVTRMGADRDTESNAQMDRRPHDLRVAGVRAAGDVGAGHLAQNRRVIAQCPTAKAFTTIGVEVNFHYGSIGARDETPRPGIRRGGESRLALYSNAMPDDLFTTMTERYRSGNLPWADELPPPEIIALCEALPPGRALDLGCGLARSCIYLAQRGWQCEGVDFVPEAIAQARERVIAAGAADRVTLHVGSVLALDQLEPPFDLAIDIGCLHAQPKEAVPVYVAQLRRLLRPGGTFVLFAHLRDEADADEQRWTTLSTLEEGFRDGFIVDRMLRGTTRMADATWASVWMWMKRS